MRKFALKSIVLAMIPAQVLALGLGDIEISSTLNQPLDAEVKLLSVRPGEADDLLVSLASNAAFLRAGIDRPFFLTKLNFKVVTKKNGDKVIKITSKRPVVEPFLNFLVEVDWPKGRLLREYTILLDPPVVVTNNTSPAKPELTNRFEQDERRFDTEPADSVRPEQVTKADSEPHEQKAKVEETSVSARETQVKAQEPAAKAKATPVADNSVASQSNEAEQEQVSKDLSKGNIERDVEKTATEKKAVTEQPDKAGSFSVQEVDSALAMEQLEALILEKTPELDGSNFTPYKIDYSVNHTNPELQDSKKGFIPIQREAKPQQVKVKKAEKAQSDQYKVEKNSTLWSIAKKTKANGVSIHQMMLSLLRYNPEAFIDGNINRLRKGVILRIPDKESALSIDPRTAVNLVKEQNALYQQYLARIKGVRVETQKKQPEAAKEPEKKTEPVKSKSAELEILKADSSEKSEEVENSGEDNQSAQGNIEDKILLTEEELISEQQNQQDLLAEKEELDSINKKLDRLIELKVNQLSDLQERLAASENDQEAGKTTQQAEETQQAEVEEKEEQKAEPVKETEIAQEKTESSEAQQQEKAEQQEVEQTNEKKETDKVQPKKLTALVENKPDVEEQASGGLFALLAAVAGFLAIAGGAIWFIRKRKKAKLEESPDLSGAEDTEDQLDSAEAPVSEAESLEDLQNKEELTEALSDLMEEDADEEKDFDQTSMETAEIPVMESAEPASETDSEAEPVAAIKEEEEEKDDTIAEADVYLAYGLYPQAEDLLTGAIKEHPDRSDYVEKLLETYFADKNIEKFQQQAESFKEMPGVAKSPAWQRVVAMGKDLCPDYPLFSQEGDVSVDIADITPTKPDAPDLALDDDAEVPVDLDFGLDDSDFESTQPEMEGDDLLDFDINEAVGETEAENEDLMGATQIMDSTDFDLDTDLDLSSDLDMDKEAENIEPLEEAGDDKMDETQLLTDTDFEMDLDDADEIANIDLGSDEDESIDSGEATDDETGLEFDLGELDDLLGENEEEVEQAESEADATEIEGNSSEEEDLLAAIGEDMEDDAASTDDLSDDLDLDDNVLDFDIGDAESDDQMAAEPEQTEDQVEETEITAEGKGLEEAELEESPDDSEAQEESAEFDPNATIVDLDEFADLDLGDEALESDDESDVQQTEYNLTDLDDLLGEDEQEQVSDQENSVAAEESAKTDEADDNFEETLVQDSEQLKANDRVDDEIDTMIELAKAYVDMGDTESAISALEEIIATGSEEQKQKAEKMLQQVKSA